MPDAVFGLQDHLFRSIFQTDAISFLGSGDGVENQVSIPHNLSPGLQIFPHSRLTVFGRRGSRAYRVKGPLLKHLGKKAMGALTRERMSSPQSTELVQFSMGK
jgi:hypothetical protein